MYTTLIIMILKRYTAEQPTVLLLITLFHSIETPDAKFIFNNKEKTVVIIIYNALGI